MYSEHPAFEKPEENAQIWKYMDFTKLVSLLDKRALYFSRLDRLSDKFEGSFPRVNIEKRNKPLDEDTIKIIKSIFPSYDRDEEMKLHSQVHKEERKIFYINSWHINNHESAAMWELYLKSDEGIAIRSRFNRLYNSLDESDRTIWIGKVKYIDYENDEIPVDNSLKVYFYKRKSFEYENELRAIAQPPNPELDYPYHKTEEFEQILQKQGRLTQGIYINVNLRTLIEAIYVSPKAEEWFYELVKSISKKYGLDKEVIQSSLGNKDPLF